MQEWRGRMSSEVFQNSLKKLRLIRKTHTWRDGGPEVVEGPSDYYVVVKGDVPTDQDGAVADSLERRQYLRPDRDRTGLKELAYRELEEEKWQGSEQEQKCVGYEKNAAYKETRRWLIGCVN